MLSQRTANLCFVTLIIAACAWFGWVAEGFETTGLLASSGLPSKFFPQLMLGGMALCAVIVGILYSVRGAAGGDEGKNVFRDAGDARRGLLMLLVSLACYGIWQAFGFIPMALLLGPASLLVMGVRQPLIYLLVWALTGFINVVFTRALGIQLA